MPIPDGKIINERFKWLSHKQYEICRAWLNSDGTTTNTRNVFTIVRERKDRIDSKIMVEIDMVPSMYQELEDGPVPHPELRPSAGMPIIMAGGDHPDGGILDGGSRKGPSVPSEMTPPGDVPPHKPVTIKDEEVGRGTMVVRPLFRSIADSGTRRPSSG